MKAAILRKILLIILILTTFFHLFRLGYPNAYVFDEVYHAFTAKEYLKGSKEAWEWWTTPPPGVAYEWTHPPLAKELMTVSMFLMHSTDAWAWRLPGALLGILSVFVVYKLALVLFKKEHIALISAFIFSLDGLNFVQSRTGMNDIYVVTFMLISLYFFLKNKFLYSSIFLGLALSSKWTGLYIFPMFALITLVNLITKKITIKKLIPAAISFTLIPATIYLISYSPFFLIGHNWDQFIELHRQMWYYHTHLKATHDYASPWWSWPLNLYPVWFYVQYFPNNIMANIFTGGNPLVFWMGSGALIVTLWDFLKNKSFSLFVVLLGFFAFWLPWAFSPRIMFLYHFSPSVPFLSLALGYQISTLTEHEKHNKLTIMIILGLILISFLIVYPVLTGIPLPKDLFLLFFKINSTKNPFGS